jgi:hypothetical protein
MTVNYPELHNKKWLHREYVENKKTIRIIAGQVGCSAGTVHAALARNGIKRRRVGGPPGLRGSKYPEFNNAEWLYHEYVIKEKDTNILAKEFGCSMTTVFNALTRAGIKMRNSSERFLVRRPDDLRLNLPVIEGGLLGDASLGRVNRKKKISNARFSRTNKYHDHVRYVAQLLSDDPDSRISSCIKKIWPSRKKTRVYFEFHTLVSKDLTPIYERWYPSSSGFKKIIPRDFRLNEVSLLHWFLDDGSTTWRKRNGRISDRAVLTFSTDCFTKDDQDFLASQMEGMGLGVRVGYIRNRKKKCHRIFVKESSVQDFFDIIGPPPVKSLAYKWKFPSSPVLPYGTRCTVTREEVLDMREKGMTFKQIEDRGGISMSYACSLAKPIKAEEG